MYELISINRTYDERSEFCVYSIHCIRKGIFKTKNFHILATDYDNMSDRKTYRKIINKRLKMKVMEWIAAFERRKPV